MAEKLPLRDPEIEVCLDQIAGARKRLALALSDANIERILNPLDWRVWFRDYPVECTLGAAAAGFLLAGSTSSRSGEGSVLEDLSRTGVEAALRLLLTSVL
jgi:hypothetical protein